MNWLEQCICFITIAITTSYRTLKIVLKNSNREYFYKEVKLWARDVLRATKTEVNVTGIQDLDFSERYIYIANHTNLIDIPILLHALHADNINFVYRESLQKVPVLGLALKKSPFVPIIRESSKDARNSVEQANSLLASGSVIMFPEGTRSFDGKIGKFKRGAFLLASLSGKKIVPITISGVETITPKDKGRKINSGTVYVHVNQPVKDIPQDRTALNKLITELQELMSQQKTVSSI